MKYLSLIAILCLMLLTWKVFTRAPLIDSQEHYLVQADLGQLIIDTVSEKVPDISDFRIKRLYTESLNSNEMKAHFSYSYVSPLEEEAVETMVSGTALIVRTPEQPGAWLLKHVQADQQALEFQTGVVITRSGGEAEIQQ